MWAILETAVYVVLAFGFGFVLLLAGRNRAGQDRTRSWLATAALLAGVWALLLGGFARLYSDYWWSFVWRRTAQIGMAVLALFGAELARSYARRPQRLPWRGLVLVVMVGAALALDAGGPGLLGGVGATVAELLGSIAPAGLLLFFAWLFLTLSALGIGVAAFRRAVGAQHLNRVRYLMLALTCIGAGDVLIWGASLQPAIWSRPAAAMAGLALRLSGLAVLAFAILRYHLPDVRHWLLRGARLALLTGLVLTVLVGGIVLLVGSTSTWQQGMDEARAVAPALAVGALLTVFFLPRVRALSDRTLLGRDYNLQRELRRYSQEVNLVLDLGRLGDITLRWLAEAMHVQRSALILLTAESEEQVQLRMAYARAVPMQLPISFEAESRFLVHFHNTGRPLSQYDLDMLAWFQGIADRERQWLAGLGVDLYVPVLIASRPVALLALGPKNGKQPYTDQDLETLMILAGQTGTALDNARLVDDLRQVQDDLAQLGAQLDETNRQLQQLNQAKSDFVAIAAHELRTPLSQIYGYSDVLTTMSGQDLSNADMVHQFIDGISRGSMRLKRVIDAMIDMSLIETGSLVLQRVPFSIPVIVKNATESVRTTAEQRQMSLVIEDLSKLPFVEVDSVRLEQVIVGLLSNAIKFTPDGGQVRVSGYHITAGQQYVVITVADNGIGVDSDQQELIFDKFYRGENLLLHSSSEARFKGAGPGLGLAIAKGIVEAHGGRIWVESPGRDETGCPGSTFHIRLPVKAPKGV